MYRYACAHFAFNSHSVQSINTIWTCVNRKSWTAVPAASCGLRYVAVLHVKRLTCHINGQTATVFFKFIKTNNDFIHCYSFWFGRKQGFLEFTLFSLLCFWGWIIAIPLDSWHSILIISSFKVKLRFSMNSFCAKPLMPCHRNVWLQTEISY